MVHRSLTGQVLKIHWPTHTPEDGHAIAACQRGNPDAELLPAAVTVDQVTCGTCRRIAANGTAARPTRRRGVDRRRKW